MKHAIAATMLVLLVALPAYGQAVKCLKADGAEEPCSWESIGTVVRESDKTFLGKEHGGRIDQHIERWKALATSGDDVEIRDLCPSACTLVLAYVPKERLCFRPCTH